MRKTGVKKREAGTLGYYFILFILPAFLIYLLFSIVPFLYTVFYSFTDYTDMNPVNLHFVGISNYLKVCDIADFFPDHTGAAFGSGFG